MIKLWPLRINGVYNCTSTFVSLYILGILHKVYYTNTRIVNKCSSRRSIRKYRMQHMFLLRYTVVAVGIYDEICKIEEQIDSPRKRNLVQLNILPGATKVLEICAVAASPRVPGILNRLVCFPIPLSVWKSVGA